MKEAYSIYDTKSHLSQILKEVKMGREIIITERGKPIVKLVPIRSKTNFQKRISLLMDQGIILPAKNKKLSKDISSKRKTGALKRFLDDR